MITAAKLKTLSTFTDEALAVALFHSGKKDALDMEVCGAKFLGFTNGNQFCYKLYYKIDGGTASRKVFLNYEPTVGKITADY